MVHTLFLLVQKIDRVIVQLIIYTILADDYPVYEDEDKREVNKVAKELRAEGFEGEIEIKKEVLK